MHSWLRRLAVKLKNSNINKETLSLIKITGYKCGYVQTAKEERNTFLIIDTPIGTRGIKTSTLPKNYFNIQVSQRGWRYQSMRGIEPIYILEFLDIRLDIKDIKERPDHDLQPAGFLYKFKTLFD